MPDQSYQKGETALRADARRNRERILLAARECYAEHGIDVPVAAVAHRAGVGIATVYRRFPTRDSLLTEAFAEQLAACAGVLDDALLDPDPWHGFRTVLEQVGLMQATDRGFGAAFLAQFADRIDLAHTGLSAEPPEVVAAASRRLIAYLLQSFRATDTPVPLPAPAPLELRHLHPGTTRLPG